MEKVASEKEINEEEVKSLWLRIVDILFIVIVVYAVLLTTILLRGEVLVRVPFI